MFAKKKKQIERAVKYAMQDLAEETADVLTNIAPISSGKYIKSFTVGITKQTLGHGPAPGFGESLFPAAQAALRIDEKNKLKQRARSLATRFPGKIISFGNMAPHAMLVEKIGWQTSPPYHVFSRAVAIINNRKKAVARKAVKRAFKT